MNKYQKKTLLKAEAQLTEVDRTLNTFSQRETSYIERIAKSE